MVGKLVFFKGKLSNYFAQKIHNGSEYTETQHLELSMQTAVQRLDQAYQNLNNSNPEYVDIAVQEINQAEVEYGLLNKKYRILQGSKVHEDMQNPRQGFPWLATRSGRNYHRIHSNNM